MLIKFIARDACSKVYQVINDTRHVHEVYDVRKLSGLNSLINL